MIEQLENIIKSNQLLSTAFILSVAGGAVMYLKSVPMDLYKLIKNKIIYTATIYQTDKLFYDFEEWFFANYKEKYRNVEASINLDPRNDYPLSEAHTEKKTEIFYKQSEGVFFLKYKGKYLYIRKGREKLEHASDMRSLFFNQYSISGVFSRNIINTLLEESVKYSNQKASENEINIFDHDVSGYWQVSGTIQSKSISNIIMPDETRKEIIEDLDAFKANKEWYTKTSIMYKRGYLFYGPPGNGKTSLALSIGGYLDRDIYCLDLNVFSSNADLKRAISNLNRNSILLIEDIDGFFRFRENSNHNSKISFSTFLNCLDGAFYKEGLITIITTNLLDTIDPALFRTGRMDKKIFIQRPQINEINQYLNLFYQDDYSLEEYQGNYSMSDVQEICLTNKEYPDMAILKLQSKMEIEA